jgi:hypothetical protein
MLWKRTKKEEERRGDSGLYVVFLDPYAGLMSSKLPGHFQWREEHIVLTNTISLPQHVGDFKPSSHGSLSFRTVNRQEELRKLCELSAKAPRRGEGAENLPTMAES